jgi:hypothetical protein
VIDAGDIRARQAFRWNLDGRRDEGTAALFDGDLIACNRIRHFDDRGAVWIERRDIASGAQRWARRVRAVATHLIRWPALDAVVAALVDGSLVVVDGDGTVLLDEPFELDGTPTLPTALAVHEETLVIGTIDGRIAMRSLR